MACDERNHRVLEQALTKMREERNELRRQNMSLHDDVVGLEAKLRRLEIWARDLENALNIVNEKGAEAQVLVEDIEVKIQEVAAALARNV
jgi:truncated hemoglobin YjbI